MQKTLTILTWTVDANMKECNKVTCTPILTQTSPCFGQHIRLFDLASPSDNPLPSNLTPYPRRPFADIMPSCSNAHQTTRSSLREPPAAFDLVLLRLFSHSHLSRIASQLLLLASRKRLINWLLTANSLKVLFNLATAGSASVAVLHGSQPVFLLVTLLLLAKLAPSRRLQPFYHSADSLHQFHAHATAACLLILGATKIPPCAMAVTRTRPVTLSIEQQTIPAQKRRKATLWPTIPRGIDQLPTIFSPGMIFMQDNPIHTAQVVKE